MQKSNWREFFPLPTPRSDQIQILDQACAAYNSGKRFVILQAGVKTSCKDQFQ